MDKKYKQPVKMKTKLRVDDEVVVISGAAKAQKGKILAIDHDKNRVFVQGVNLKKRKMRPTQENPKGGILEVESAIHLSNVALFDAKSKGPSRIKMATDKNGKKVRVLAKSQKELG